MGSISTLVLYVAMVTTLRPGQLFCTAQNGVASSTGDGGMHFKSVAPPEEALKALDDLIRKIRATITETDADAGALPRMAAGQLQAAMGRARHSVVGTCARMLGLLVDGSVVELCTHQAVFSCAVVFESSDSVAVRHAGIELLEAMEADPAFATYWNSDPRVVETHAVWARMYMANSNRERAAHRSLIAAAGFFDANPLNSPVTNAPKRGEQHLSDSICLLRQLGQNAEAETHFNMAVQQGRIPWRNSLQRPGEMIAALFGVQYPTDPISEGGAGLPTPETVNNVVQHYGALKLEFDALIQSKTFENQSTSGTKLVEGRDPGAWHAFTVCSQGVWDDDACKHMPTLCKILRNDKMVSGRIPPEKVKAINDGGGWTPPESANAWIEPAYRGVQRPLEVGTFRFSGGYVPHLGISVLRLAPGSRLVPHTGSSNGRLNMHLAFQVPASKVGLRVGDQDRVWEAGKAIVFDESYEHEVWNDNDAALNDPALARYVLQIHMWHPGLASLVEDVGSTAWDTADDSTEYESHAAT